MEVFVEKDGLLEIDTWKDIPNLIVGFTLKNDNQNQGLHVGDIKENVIKSRTRVADKTGFPLETWVATQPTHGKNLAKVDVTFKGRGSKDFEDGIEDCDGLYTSDKGVLLTHVYADCTPVFYLHRKTNKIGIAHAGWRGTALGIAAEMVELWKGEGIDPSEVEVVIGPALCPKCSIIDEEIIDEIMANVKATGVVKALRNDGNGNVRLDMQTANELHLLYSGVKAENIRTTGLCTSCDNRFFSHSRDNQNTGRMMGYIGWKG